MARHRITCLSCVHWSLKLLNDNIFVPPAAIYSLFHVSASDVIKDWTCKDKDKDQAYKNKDKD